MTNGDVPAEALQEEKESLELLKLGQLELARYKIAMLCKKYPIAKFHFNYALVLYKLKRYDEALDEINAGLWLKPDDLKATKFKKEIIEMRSKAGAAETARINEPETVSTTPGSLKEEKAVVAAPAKEAPPEQEAPKPEPVVTASAKEAPPEQEPTKPEPVVTAPAKEAPPEQEPTKPEPVATVPAQEPQNAPSGSLPKPEPTGEKQSITSTQPETMPAIRVQSPQPVKPGPEPEVMPAVKVPALPDEAAKTIEPIIAPTIPPAIPEQPPSNERIAEPLAEQAPTAIVPPAETKPAPGPVAPNEPGQKAGDSEAPAPAGNDKPPTEAAPTGTTPHPAVESQPEQEKQPSSEAEQSKPENASVDAPRVEHVDELEPAIVAAAGSASVEPAAEPALVSSIPGPSVIDTAPGEGQQLAHADTIEVEPRVTILEKAADITVEALETSAATPAEEPEKKKEPASETPTPTEKHETATEPPAASSPRLTNLKDLFKGSHARAEQPPEPIPDTGAVLEDTVELEPGHEPKIPDAIARPGKGELVTFASYKELESYKFSIQALVEKYLQHKLDHEIPDMGDDGSMPVIVEDETTPSEESVPFEESDLPPHEAASIDEVGSAAGPTSDSTPRAEPQTASAVTAVHADAVPAPSTNATPDAGHVIAAATASAAAATRGGLGNVAGSQQSLVEILSATSGHLPHRQDIDLIKFINSTVMAKARTGKLMQVRGESLAQIVDMETYATLVRINRTFERKKTSRLNTIKLPFADEAIKVLESGTQPTKGYRPDSFLKEESVDVESQFAQLASGSQQSLTDDALAKFLEQIREVGEGQALMSADGDSAPLKAATGKIKRVALDLYNNTQYEQAVQIYTTFVDYFPEDFEALFNLGFCHRELGNYKESEAMFKRIVELFYDNAYAWYNLSVIYSLTTEGDKEAYCLQRAREFGYAVDVNRLSRLMVTYTPKNPFDS